MNETITDKFRDPTHIRIRIVRLAIGVERISSSGGSSSAASPRERDAADANAAPTNNAARNPAIIREALKKIAVRNGG